MIRFALTLALALPATQALALSCLRPDPETTFDRAAEATETYYVAHGRFTFDAADLPGLNGRPTQLQAGFQGKGLTRDGFVAPLTWNVTLDIGCAGPWCGGITPDRDMLVFLERRGNGIYLSLQACTDTVFDTPSQDLLDRMTACFRQGVCGT